MVYVIFGRMNPPTKGHEALIKKALNKGEIVHVYVSQTQNHSINPLSPNTKIKLIEKMFPEHVSNGRLVVGDAKVPHNTIRLAEGANTKDIKLLVGSNRMPKNPLNLTQNERGTLKYLLKMASEGRLPALTMEKHNQNRVKINLDNLPKNLSTINLKSVSGSLVRRAIEKNYNISQL